MSFDVTFFKPNELVAAIDEIQVNRTAKHLCNYFLKYAQNEVKFNNHQGNLFEINISELNEEAQIQLKDYKLLDKYLTALMRPVTIRDKDDPQNFIKLVPIYRVNVNIKKGIYQFKLDEDIIDLLRKTDYFTKLELHELNFLISKHSLVLYEWLKRYETAPKIPQISIDDLRKITNTADKKSYNDFKNVQLKILDVAVKEISEKTPYMVSYEIIKARGKTKPRVAAIQFTFTRKPTSPDVATQDLVSNDPVYKKIKNLCKFFTVEKYNIATYSYPVFTLNVYIDSLVEKGYTPNEKDFFKWLNDRCSINQKNYYRQQTVLNEELFRKVFSITEEKYSMEITMSSGEKIPAGFSQTVRTVYEKYVNEAMKEYGRMPYSKYRDYLSSLWDKFKKETNVNKDNIFRTMGG